MPNLSTKRRQLAFTLVELMIALTLGSLIILAVTQVYLSSAQTQRLHNELALINDKSLFALELIERNLRETGFGSCSPETMIGDWVNWGDPATSMSAMLRLNVGIRGFEHSGTQRGDSYTLPGTRSFVTNPITPIPNTTLPGSDILVLQYRNTQQVRVAGPAPSGALGNNALCLGGVGFAGNLLQVQHNGTIPNNSLVFLEDGCQSGDLFVSAVSTNNGIISLNKNNTFNKAGAGAPGFCHTYTIGQEISLTIIEQRAFFIMPNPSGEPALFMQTFDTNNKQVALTEIIAGVEAMQITYGLHNNASTRSVSNYVSANAVADWQQVVSVNVSLLLRSNDNVLPESQSKSYLVNGTTLVTPKDRRARQVLSSTTAIRNQTL